MIRPQSRMPVLQAFLTKDCIAHEAFELRFFNMHIFDIAGEYFSERAVTAAEQSVDIQKKRSFP